ncbi:MAG TPA: hypothetical protein VIK90_06125 [Limnochordales bacterium]
MSATEAGSGRASRRSGPPGGWAGGATQSGKLLRTSRLFNPRSGRSVIVALDHGMMGRPEGLGRLDETLEALLPEAPEGVLLNPGMLPRVAPRLAGRGGPAVVVGLNWHFTGTDPSGPPVGQAHRALASLQRAVALGADAVKLLLVFGEESLEAFADNVAFVASVVEASDQLGIPVMVEPTLWTGPGRPARTPTLEQLAHMVRVAAELGADLLKVPFVPPAEAYRRLVEESPVPVLILGGARASSAEAVLEGAREAVRAGAAGLVFGRNVWQQPDPRAMLAALMEVVHGGPA